GSFPHRLHCPRPAILRAAAWLFSPDWKREEKGGALSGCRFEFDTATDQLDEFLAGGKADTGAGIIFLAVQPLENGEDPPMEHRIDADAVVAHAESPEAVLPLRMDGDFGRSAAVLELQRIAHEVLQQHAHQRRAGFERGQRAAIDAGIFFADG